MKKSLITANQIAERLGIQSQTVYLWVRQKRIPFYRVGRLIKFDQQEVLAHFKVEVEKKDDAGKTQTVEPRPTSRSTTEIYPFRTLRTTTELAGDQWYRKLFGLE
jgi:excisionase family DNA binding protein